MTQRRAVITGLGGITPLGSDLSTIWKRMVNGESGIGRITKMDSEPYDSHVGGELSDYDLNDEFNRKEQRQIEIFSLYGMSAARRAMQDSGLSVEGEDPYRLGVILSSGVGGLHTYLEQAKVIFEKGPSRLSPFMIPKVICNIASGHIAIDLGFKGPNFCVVTACASATHSLGEALRLIQRGDADAVMTGGTEAPINEYGLGGFCALRALSTARNDEPEKASRPFDAERDGFVIAEGAVGLLVEEYEHAKARGAKIYCELAGFGQTCDAYHITAPDPDGEGAAQAMSLAVADAGLNTDEIQYINAHGTSTQLNDKGETMAVKVAFGEEQARKLTISSTKSMTGHLLGAAGAIEGLACAMALKEGILPPTINYENPDPECDLDYVPNEAREVEITACLSNSLGFGGHNASLCFKKI